MDVFKEVASPNAGACGIRYLCSSDSVFYHRKMSKRKAPIYRSAAREKTKHQVKDEVILNSLSNPVDNLVELESVNIPRQEYGFLSVTTDKAEAVKKETFNGAD